MSVTGELPRETSTWAILDLDKWFLFCFPPHGGQEKRMALSGVFSLFSSRSGLVGCWEGKPVPCLPVCAASGGQSWTLAQWVEDYYTLQSLLANNCSQGPLLSQPLLFHRAVRCKKGRSFGSPLRKQGLLELWGKKPQTVHFHEKKGSNLFSELAVGFSTTHTAQHSCGNSTDGAQEPTVRRKEHT